MVITFNNNLDLPSSLKTFRYLTITPTDCHEIIMSAKIALDNKRLLEKEIREATLFKVV